MSGNYRALTRKYRPQTFEDIVSQEHVSSTLKNAIASKRLSHAYMFCGPRGVGKTTMARVLARAINEVDETVDGEMLSQTLNIVEIDAASNNKVEDVHHLREVVRVPPQNGNFKIFIIDEVHMLSKQAFNALLKTLEEPPPYAIFIFATTEPHKILPTILSRVQRFDFRRISVDEIVVRLKEISEKEGISIDNESLHTIARRADGALRDALGLMDQAIAFCGLTIEYKELVNALNMVGNDQLFEFTEAVAGQNAAAALTLIDRLLKEGVDIQEFLVSLTEHIRNIYVASGSDQMYLVEATQETKERYRGAAKSFTESDLMRMLHTVSEAQIRIRDVQQPRVHFEIMALKLVHMSRNRTLEELLDAAEALKKKSVSPAGNPESGLNRAESGSAGDADMPIQTQTNQPGVQVSSPASTDSGWIQAAEAAERTEQQGDRFTEPSGEGNPLHRDAHGIRNEEISRSDKTGFSDRAERQTDEPNRKRAAGSPEMHSEGRELTDQQARTEDLNETELEEDLILNGRPALFKERVRTQAVSRKSAGEQSQSAKEEVRKVRSLEEVEVLWKDYLSLLERSVSKMLFHQMEDVRLKELRGNELVLSVHDPFAANMVEENKLELASLLKSIIGIQVRFRCLEERKESVGSQAMSPYDRFREIQKNDPHLKTIVELFGAELQY
ncbi:MAG: DNA polymerase III subunit gamma/tau [Balneolaceae bacterium]|nr:MAG: DNA polymerase III subunit gamma/tau [Balneolaceae bacterium]